MRTASLTSALFLLLLSAALFAQTPPLPYHQILVPVIVNDVPGGYGSVWTSALWAVNSGTQAAVITPLPCVITGDDCSTDVVVAPGRSVQIPAFGRPETPGAIVGISGELAQDVFFTLHVRDLSRQSESWGTEIPVVRTTGFFTHPTSITSIPVGTAYRHTLRLYSIPTPANPQLRLKLYAVVTGAADVLIVETRIVMPRRADPPPNQIGSPLSQVTVTDLFARQFPGAERLRLTIEPIADPATGVAPYWALMTVTNNATQQVATIMPR